ncbi:copper homeostasis protein [Lishizhenia tianjinensis]|uniref:PF03932 family protein CutC n=1 Tax=Lishizhenia tianjinensis TaxID=477690 RepID=A0A1I6ZWU0_9FLAO|nr:copper homeostasis protein CutC [Lishizhenia tianjinensis]SFT67106.1 copper homeostasis protein [Lishizhenia tianjinensis]
MELELCAASYSSALKSNHHPFKRVELCANLEQGGTTPSPGTIAATVENVDAECHVLIRPRVGNFNYSSEEIQVMQQDILLAKSLGAKGVVFGVMNSQDRFDLNKNLLLLEAAEGMQSTFHRAVDSSSAYMKDIQSIINCGFQRVLTSGGGTNVEAGKEQLKELMLSNPDIEVMIGGGINTTNVKQLYDYIQPHAIHFSATDWVKDESKNMYTTNYLETSLSKMKEILAQL